jgi:hypothetical protein
METIAPPRPFVERRRPFSVAPRGVNFVERRRPAPVLLRDIDDLHDADLDGVLADGLAYGLSTAQAVEAALALAELIGAARPGVHFAHDLAPGAQTFAA